MIRHRGSLEFAHRLLDGTGSASDIDQEKSLGKSCASENSCHFCISGEPAAHRATGAGCCRQAEVQRRNAFKLSQVDDRLGQAVTGV